MQDLYGDFMDNGTDAPCVKTATDVVDLCGDTNETPPITKSCPFTQAETPVKPTPIPKMKIKIEKE